jgi:arginine/lysine/ornithine decarboxylase
MLRAAVFENVTFVCAGGLDSLLDPTGTIKVAQEKAAVAFGAQHTYFVTNGTSTANKIVCQALMAPGDIVLIDRDCHKVGTAAGGGVQRCEQKQQRAWVRKMDRVHKC